MPWRCRLQWSITSLTESADSSSGISQIGPLGPFHIAVDEGRSLAVTIRFLGGLGVIGRNCMAIRDGNDVLIVDAGLYFPDLSAFGVDIALPDFTALTDEAEMVKGIVLTHGHEDHIGALGALSELVSAPVFGSRVTMALASKRLEESHASNEVVEVADYDSVSIGRFTVTFYPVAHSVPDSMALKIETSEGVIYHTGDFKLDPTPLDCRTTDLRPLAAMGASGGVDLLLVDSTNAEEPGWTESELAVRPGLQAVFTKYPDRRLVCSCFASHIHRITQIVAEARKHRRKIIPVGRSMVRVFEIGREMGLIDLPADEMASLRELDSLPPEMVCILATGSQGEPRAALSLMARGEHKQVKLSSKDLILLSTEAIPGNESDVGRLIDQLARCGVEVVHEGMLKVHVSGHAKRDELGHVVTAARPKSVVPIHGEYRHMTSMARLVAEVSPRSSVLIAEDGHVIELSGGRVAKIDEFPAPYIYRSNHAGQEVERAVVRQRMTLQSGGILIVTVYTEEDKVASVSAEQFGWLNPSMFVSIVDGIEDAVEAMTTEALAKRVSSPDMEAHLQALVRKYARSVSRVAPHVVVFYESDRE